MRSYYVYITTNRFGRELQIDIPNVLERRMTDHKSGKRSLFTVIEEERDPSTSSG
jgi:predicted GIY-YIG superfamily endonuclease